MRKVLAVNNTGTLIVDTMEKYSFRRKYAEEYGQAALDNYSKEDIGKAKTLMEKLRIPVSPFSNTLDFLTTLRDSGIGVVAFAGAKPEVSFELYKKIDFEIGGAYWIGDEEIPEELRFNRKNPELFKVITPKMRQDGFDPVAYLTHLEDHATAAAEAFGKALLCRTKAENPDNRIYTFDWNGLTKSEINKIIEFLKSS